MPLVPSSLRPLQPPHSSQVQLEPPPAHSPACADPLTRRHSELEGNHVLVSAGSVAYPTLRWSMRSSP